MSTIQIITIIKAPIAVIFDLNRNIDIHLLSTSQSKEKAIAGRTSGLIEKDETVTWKAKHFGFYLTHQSFIPEMKKPLYFVDEMTKGQFKFFRHTHTFEQEDNFVIMTDHIVYETPFSFLGKLFDILVLKKYLTSFIQKRNHMIKELAENEKIA